MLTRFESSVFNCRTLVFLNACNPDFHTMNWNFISHQQKRNSKPPNNFRNLFDTLLLTYCRHTMCKQRFDVVFSIQNRHRQYSKITIITVNFSTDLIRCHRKLPEIMFIYFSRYAPPPANEMAISMRRCAFIANAPPFMCTNGTTQITKRKIFIQLSNAISIRWTKVQYTRPLWIK